MQPHYTSSHGTKVTHFTHEVNGKYRIACIPGLEQLHKTRDHANYLRTNDHRAVTCPACKMSHVYNEVVKASNAQAKR